MFNVTRSVTQKTFGSLAARPVVWFPTGAPRFDRKRVRSRRVGHSVTGMLRIPVLSKKYAALTNKKFWESV
jgi:hypothetical protein